MTDQMSTSSKKGTSICLDQMLFYVWIDLLYGVIQKWHQINFTIVYPIHCHPSNALKISPQYQFLYPLKGEILYGKVHSKIKMKKKGE